MATELCSNQAKYGSTLANQRRRLRSRAMSRSCSSKGFNVAMRAYAKPNRRTLFGCPTSVSLTDVHVREQAINALRRLQLTFPTQCISDILQDIASRKISTQANPLDNVRRLRCHVFEFERRMYRESKVRSSELKTLFFSETDLYGVLVERIVDYDAVCYVARLYPNFSRFWLDFFV